MRLFGAAKSPEIPKTSDGRRVPTITVEIREDRDRPVLFIDAPGRPTRGIRLGGGIERVRAQSRRILEHFAKLASARVTPETLETRAKRTLDLVDAVFHQLLDIHGVSAQDHLSAGELTAGKILRAEIQRLMKEGGPIYFRSLDNYGMLPWELFTLDTNDTAQRLSEVAWLARIDRGRADDTPFVNGPEVAVHTVHPPFKVLFLKGDNLAAADDELARLKGITPAFAIDCIDNKPKAKTRKEVVAAMVGGAKGGCDIFHFACHCKISAEGGTSFTFDIAGNSSVRDNDISKGIDEANARSELPIIFLNVCYGAADRPHTMSPTDQFLSLGAKAVISAADLVNDDAAPIFAEAVYTTIAERLTRNGKPREIRLSEALYEARQSVRRWARENKRTDSARAATALQRLTPETFMVTAQGGDLLLRAY